MLDYISDLAPNSEFKCYSLGYRSTLYRFDDELFITKTPGEAFLNGNLYTN